MLRWVYDAHILLKIVTARRVTFCNLVRYQIVMLGYR